MRDPAQGHDAHAVLCFPCCAPPCSPPPPRAVPRGCRVQLKAVLAHNTNLSQRVRHLEETVVRQQASIGHLGAMLGLDAGGAWQGAPGAQQQQQRYGEDPGHAAA